MSFKDIQLIPFLQQKWPTFTCSYIPAVGNLVLDFDLPGIWGALISGIDGLFESAARDAKVQKFDRICAVATW